MTPDVNNVFNKVSLNLYSSALCLKTVFECLGFWLSASLNFHDLVYPRVYFGLISN